jgi:isopentenyl-diphosphate delta-isomerase
MLEDSTAKFSFELRKFAPTTVLIANLGAVQLNYGLGIKDCNQVIETLQADAIFLHLNALQEVVQPEGDTNFTNLKTKIKAIKSQLDVPLLIKEVGCGFSLKNLEDLIQLGIDYIDLAGRGGTSWSKIEGLRHDHRHDIGHLFQDWGLSTVEILKQVTILQGNYNLIASGGIRSGLDLAKSLILGAKLGGIALPLLNEASESSQAVIEKIKAFQKELQTTMFLLGVKTIEELQANPSLFINEDYTCQK